jgi:hypothetical protein
MGWDSGVFQFRKNQRSGWNHGCVEELSGWKSEYLVVHTKISVAGMLAG